MNVEGAAILIETLRRMTELAAETAPTWPPWELGEHEEQLERGPRYSAGTWWGSVSEAERMRLLRAINMLEREGLVLAYRPEGRLKNLKLTATGIKAAREMVEIATEMGAELPASVTEA